MNEASASRIKTAALLGSLLALSGFCSFFLYALIHVSERSFRDYLGGRPLPQLTSVCLDYRLAILLLPVPWLAIAVWLITRPDTSAFRLTAFSSTLILAVITAAILVIAALAFPWLPIRMGLNPR